MPQTAGLELLIGPIIQSEKNLLVSLEAGTSEPPLGLRRSARLPVLAGLYSELKRSILVVTDRADRALTIFDELGLWLPDAPRLLFPEPTPLFYENASWGESTRRERLTALTTLAAYHIPGAPRLDQPPILVAPARALMTRTIPRRDFLKAARTLKVGQVIRIDELSRICLRLNYESVNTVIAPGQFARRGGILDIWPTAEAQPLRLEFFGDEIDTLREFDPSTQRTSKPSDDADEARILITPAREFLLRDGELPTEMDEGPSEFYLPLFHPTPAGLLDYLPRQALVLVDDRQALEEVISEIETQARRNPARLDL